MRGIGWVLVLGLVAAGPARANVGSALMVCKYIHLSFLNFAIAAVECWVLLWLWRRRERSWVFPWLLAANLASAIIGVVYLPWLLSPLTVALLGEPPYLRWQLALAALYAACFVVSVAIEWPFVHRALRRPAIRDSLRACLVANTASYVLLIAHYGSLSEHTLFTDVDIVPAATIDSDEQSRVAVISDGGVVFSVRLDGSDQQVLGRVDGPRSGVRLYLELSADTDTPAYDLRAYRSMADRRRWMLAAKDLDMLVAENIAPCMSSSDETAQPTGHPSQARWQYRIGLDRQVGAVDGLNDPWHGLRLDRGGAAINWRHEDLVTLIGAFEPTVMPDGLVVFQLGHGGIWPKVRFQPIFVLDLANRRVAKIARGQSFVAYRTGPSADPTHD